MWEQWTSFLYNGENIAFLILSVFVISGAVLMISFTRVVHMVVAVAMSFLGLAGLYVLLQAEFVAFVQVLVYAGSIVILMIFGIMLTNHARQEDEPKRPLHKTLVLLGILAFFGVLFYTIQQAAFPLSDTTYAEGNTREIGEQLFTQYVIPFELMSVLLTVAFIGAIIVAKREED